MAEKQIRDEFSKGTIDALAKRAAQTCSNPDCHKLTSGPQLEETGFVILGVASHITAAAPGGPRYDPSLTSDQRSSITNGIWLCENCAKMIDRDLVKYTVELLHQWKQDHEAWVTTRIVSSVNGRSQQTQQDDFKEVTDLLTKVYSNSVPLSQCLVEALPIARKFKSNELLSFCKNELEGMVNKNIRPFPTYRLMPYSISFSKLNIGSLAWGGDIDAVWRFIQNSPNHFTPVTLFMTLPISELESKDSVDAHKHIFTWEDPLSKYNTGASDPNRTVYCYARGESYSNLIQSIRVEFTKLLISLLPQQH